jgi:hypothetical protein
MTDKSQTSKPRKDFDFGLRMENIRGLNLAVVKLTIVQVTKLPL